MQSQDRLVHHSGEQEDLVDLLLLGHSPELVLEGNGDLGFEQAFLLVRAYHNSGLVYQNPCLVSISGTLILRWDFDTLSAAQPGRREGFRVDVTKTDVSVTERSDVWETW